MKVAIGSDHAGYRMKEAVKEAFDSHYEIIDTGTDSENSCDYPVFANRVCRSVLNKKAERGILICGTGIGMSMMANRFEGIRAALCHDEFTAERARQHNDANIIAMGSQVVDRETAVKLVRIFLEETFDRSDPANERHVRRIEELDSLIKEP